jgi:ABC-type transporter Mla subunit MlaD
VSEALNGHASEGEKLAQRLAAAEEQYDTGLRKLTATAKQIAQLQSQVRGSQKASSRLVMDLRRLPSREALALRAQAAASAATAEAQAQGLERTLWRLAKKGVY